MQLRFRCVEHSQTLPSNGAHGSTLLGFWIGLWGMWLTQKSKHVQTALVSGNGTEMRRDQTIFNGHLRGNYLPNSIQFWYQMAFFLMIAANTILVSQLQFWRWLCSPFVVLMCSLVTCVKSSGTVELLWSGGASFEDPILWAIWISQEAHVWRSMCVLLKD